MRVMVIVKANPESEGGALPSPELIEAMGAYNNELIAAGVMLDGGGLQSSAKGARVRIQRGQALVYCRADISGPLSEHGEQFGLGGDEIDESGVDATSVRCWVEKFGSEK